jgi:hypothetical protein
LRQAYDYWQDQPGSYLRSAPAGDPPSSPPRSTTRRVHTPLSQSEPQPRTTVRGREKVKEGIGRRVRAHRVSWGRPAGHIPAHEWAESSAGSVCFVRTGARFAGAERSRPRTPTNSGSLVPSPVGPFPRLELALRRHSQLPHLRATTGRFPQAQPWRYTAHTNPLPP